MPQRLELFYSNLNRQNMRRRLFYIYKWNSGRRDATREGYEEWLKGLVAWMEETSGIELPTDDTFFEEYNGDETTEEITPEEEEEMFGEKPEIEGEKGDAELTPAETTEDVTDVAGKGKKKGDEAVDEVKDAVDEGVKETTPETEKPKEEVTEETPGATEKEGEAEAPGATEKEGEAEVAP